MLDAMIGSEGKFYVYKGKKNISDLVNEKKNKQVQSTTVLLKM